MAPNSPGRRRICENDEKIQLGIRQISMDGENPQYPQKYIVDIDSKL